MTDRELLEAAANAFGTKWKWVRAPIYDHEEVPGLHHLDSVNDVDYYFAWNPLRDRAQNFALAAKLRIDIRHWDGPDRVSAEHPSLPELSTMTDVGDNPEAAIMRCVVRAAAALAVSDLAKREGTR